MTVDIGERIRQRGEEALFDRPGVSDLATHPTVVPAERHLVGPLVVLGLEIGDAGERTQRKERGLEIADGAFHLTLRLRFAGPQDDRAHPERTEQACHLRMEPSRTGPGHHDRGVPIHHHCLGTPPSRSRVPENAGRKSAIVLERANTVACAAECGSVVTSPNTFLWAPLPTDGGHEILPIGGH